MSGALTTALYLARRAAQKERVRILYRHALKDTLNWAVHRHLFYKDADYLRMKFEANKHVEDLDTIDRLMDNAEATYNKWRHPDPYIVLWAPGGSKFCRNPTPPDGNYLLKQPEFAARLNRMSQPDWSSGLKSIRLICSKSGDHPAKAHNGNAINPDTWDIVKALEAQKMPTKQAEAIASAITENLKIFINMELQREREKCDYEIEKTLCELSCEIDKLKARRLVYKTISNSNKKIKEVSLSFKATAARTKDFKFCSILSWIISFIFVAASYPG